MNILVTGNKGFIGTHLQRVLTSHGHTVIGCDKKNGVDIFDPFVETQVKESDIVYHLAAQTSVNQSFENEGEVFRTNAIGTARIVDWCVKYHKKLIFPSTAAVYFRNFSPYAQSKAVAEDIVWGVHKSIPVVILRLYNVFGPHMNPDSGSIMYTFVTDKSINVYGDGEQTRDFIHVDDVVGILGAAVLNKWNDMIVDVGTGQAHTINYIASLFSFYRNLPILYKNPRRETRWSIAETSLLRTLYKKPLMTDIPKQVKELVEYYGTH